MIVHKNVLSRVYFMNSVWCSSTSAQIKTSYQYTKDILNSFSFNKTQNISVDKLKNMYV